MGSWTHLALSSPLSYILAFLLPAGDAIVPVLPGEAVVIALGVATAGSTDPRIFALVLLAAAGACVGDNVGYLIGRRFGWIADRWVFRGVRGARVRAWAEQALERFGAWIVVACRFIPGGRTAVTLTCGIVGFQHRTFVAATVAAGIIWASYAYFLGRIGGQAFEDKPWLGLLIASGAALVVSVIVEGVRRLLAWRTARRRQRNAPDAPDEGSAPDGPVTGTSDREETRGEERSEPRSRP